MKPLSGICNLLMRKTILLFTLLLLQAYCFGQDIQFYQVVPPAPEAAALGKYGEIPVSLNVGMPQIAIPLYEISGPQLNVPISLQYYSQGLKNSEVASCVGLGWSLQAGGVITRVVKGWPDEFSNGFYNMLPKYINDIRYTICPPGSCEGPGLLYKACDWRLQAVYGELDLEPDEYYFNFNNYTGHFMVNENKEVVCFPEQNLKIEYNDHYSWIITTPDGIRYDFSSREVSSFNSGGYTSAWYLTNITSPDGDFVDFEYKLAFQGWRKETLSYNKFFVVNPIHIYAPQGGTCASPISFFQTEFPTTTISYLTQINYPQSRIKVNLAYKNDRKDTDSNNPYSLRRLEKITVTSQMFSSEEVVRNYEFDNNGYFGSATTMDEGMLKLSAITETLSQAKHTFKYHNEHEVFSGCGSPNSDHWGFCNGAGNSNPVPAMPYQYGMAYQYPPPAANANREPSFSHTEACMLTEIIYPTGGNTRFSWEPNMVTYENVYVDTQKSINYNICTSGSFSMNMEEQQLADYLHSQHIDDLNMPVNVRVTSFIFKSNYNFISFNVLLEGANQTGLIGAYLYKASDTTEQLYWKGLPFTYAVPLVDMCSHPEFKQIPLNNSKMEIEQGTYLLITLVSRNSNNMSISVSGSYMENVFHPYLDKLAGGVRIAEIITNDDNSPQNTIVKSYDYTKNFRQPKPGNSVRSSGKLFLDPYYGVNVSYCHIDQCKRLIMNSHLVDPLGFPIQIKGGHIGYSEVTEIINNKAGGFVTTHFKNEEEHFSRNLVLREETYNSNQEIVKSIENEYIYTTALSQPVTTEIRIWFTKTIMKEVPCFSVNGNPVISIVFDLAFGEYLPYTINSKWYGISERKEKLYNGNDFITSITQYDYDGLENNGNKKHFFPTRITTQMSDGSLFMKKNRYAMDFNSPNSSINILQVRYANKLIEEQNYRNSALISSVYTKYNDKTNPIEIYRCNFSKLNNPGLASNGDLAPNTFYEKYLSFQRAAIRDNILTQTLLDATFKSYIWGYNNSLPVVEIENLEYSEIPLNVRNQIAQYTFSNSCDPNLIRQDILFMQNQLENIGTNKPHLITLYTYKSAVGITSVTNPSGFTTFYEYDEFGRLKVIKDHMGSILQFNEYKYKTANSDYFSISAGKNYFARCTPIEAVQQLSDLSREEQLRSLSVQYYDGLGRPIQTVLPLHTPEGNDLVSAIGYDAFGRESKRYLPVPVGGNNGGNYVDVTPLNTARQNFYDTEAIRAFAEIKYEPSPLNRVMTNVMPGVNWLNNTVRHNYDGNPDPVPSWHCNGTGNFTPLTYPAYSLFMQKTTDPDERVVREYKDKLGNVVMTEAYDGNDWLQTRFVYDDFGLRRAVLMPEAVDADDQDHCYYYNYDSHRRVFEVKEPGGDWVYNVYDKRDRLVYTQDGNNQNNNQWKRISYDDFNRETGAELCSDIQTYSRQDLQDEVDINAVVNFTEILPLYTTYYDNYDALGMIDNGNDLQFEPNDVSGSNHAANNKGRITAKSTAILPSLPPTPSRGGGELTTVFYYDDYGRVIQTVATNHIGGIDRISTEYDFRGNVLQTLQESDWMDESQDPGSITLHQTIDYDAVKRPTTVNLKINDQDPQPISQLTYDELDRVSVKSLHNGSESTTYTYNIQNWIKQITGSLFSQKLYYEEVPQGSSNIAPQWGGNISAMSWDTPAKGLHYYGFTYDGVSRLLGTRYGVNGVWGDSYTEHLTYDKNGNIKTLQRYGANSTLIDNMSYTYSGNQITEIFNDVVITQGFPAGSTPYTHDANGNVVWEGNTQITYNLLNLPQTVRLVADRTIVNTYTADGRKLAAVAEDGTQKIDEGTKIYNGNLVFDINGELEYILFPEGRILHDNGNFTYEYHLRDHLGSTRVVFEPTTGGNEVKQINAYYPFGAPIAALSWSNQLSNPNRYKHTGMETIEDFGLGYVDNGARWRGSPFAPGFRTRDPLAAKYPHLSPYIYCANNPLKFIDPNGREIWIYYDDDEGKRQSMLYSANMKYEGSNAFVSASVNYLNSVYSNGGAGVMDVLIGSNNSFNMLNQTPTDKNGNPLDALKFSEASGGGGDIYAGMLTNSKYSDFSKVEGVSHELFHGLQHENGQGGTSIFNEVEAYVYSSVIATNWLSSTDYFGAMSSNGIGNRTTAGNLYETSFSNLIKNGFSKDAFSNAVESFKAGSVSNATGGYNTYPLYRNQTNYLLQKYFPKLQ